MKYFERGLSKIPKKSNFIYFLNSVPFPGNHYKNKRGSELVSSIFTDCQICSSYLSLVIHYLMNFGAFQRSFELFQKLQFISYASSFMMP